VTAGFLPGPSRPLGLAFLAALGLTLALDAALPRGFLRANGILDQGLLRGFSECDKETFTRLGHTASVIEVPAFAPLSVVEAQVELLRPRDLRLVEDQEAVFSKNAIKATLRADENGSVSLHLQDQGGKKRGIFELVRVTLVGTPGLGPWRRLLSETALLLLLGLFALWAIPEGRGATLVFLVSAGLFDLALVFFRFYLLAALPGLLLLLLLALPFALLLGALGVPRRHGRLILPVFLFRLGLVLLPSFPAIDLEFHAHNVERFRNGEILKSRAPGAERGESLPVPYPPALYALLATFPPGSEETLLRAGMGLLEGTAPLLVFLSLRAAGASSEVAGYGALIHVLLPEGILVLGKGIAANILASWATLFFAWAYLRRAGVALLAALLSLVFVSHFGASLCLGLLLVLLLAHREDQKGLLVASLIAAVVSFAVYYREVLALATGILSNLGGHAQGAPSAFFRLRWVRVLKTLQDLLLKFGGGSLVLLRFGSDLPPRLGRLLRAWFRVGIGLGLLALLTPIPLRFEYFLLAPVAMRGAYGAEALEREGRGSSLAFLLALCLLVQVAIGIFLLFQRFDLISVIQESDRWGFPFLWCARVSG
jgi:hypothetical protein